MITNKEELLRKINYSDKLCIQLLSNRWQAVGFTILLISGFWTIMLSKSLDKDQSINNIYLLFFLGTLFSIIVLSLWRYVNHVITEEEFGHKDSIFKNRKLIEDLSISNPGYCDDQLRIKIDSIEKNELKIDHFLEGLNNEFDYDEEKPASYALFQKFFSLSDEKKLEFSKKNLKNLYPIRFEKGQRNFDLYVFYCVSCFGIIGEVLLILLLYLNFNFLSMIFKDFTFWIYIGASVSYTGLFMLFDGLLVIYIFSNFWKRNSSTRIDQIVDAIRSVIEGK